jgi:ornithine cyclodeaminase
MRESARDPAPGDHQVNPAGPAPGMLLLLREGAIRTLFDPRAGLEAIEAAFAAYSTGKADLPSVIQLNVPEEEAEIHIKAGHLYGAPFWAVKVAGSFPNNPGRGLAASGGMVMAFDARTGAPAALLLDNGYITDLRTGLAGAVAARHLSRKDASVAAVLGTGSQARHQVRCLALVRPLREIRIWGRHEDRAKGLARELSTEESMRGIRVRAAASVEEAVRGATLVVTTTASREPILRAAWIAPGAHITAVGSDQPDKQEIEAALVARADVLVADSRPQCLRLGEIHHAVEAGAITPDDIDAELGEIVAGTKPGRVSDDAVTLCDLTGLGVQDVASANLILERARTTGAPGETVPL